MKRYLKGIFAFIIMVFPMVVNAEDITTASSPYYLEEQDIFVANGTAIVIEERDSGTYATWEGEGNEQVLTSNTVVVGGYYNPFTTGTNTIDLASTSITMNSGTVGAILGGNAVDKNYNAYSKIHVGTINIDINGGNIAEVSAVSMAHKKINTALNASYYKKIENYYYADKVNISVSKANISTRLYVLSSYTYAKDVVVNITDNAEIHAGYYALAVGTNGKVGNFVVNIDNSIVDMIHSGFRAMVDYMEVNITGTSTVGDIYAGSYYPESEKSSNGWWSGNIGYVDYGQVGEIVFNIDEDVKYNNIYAGFQFATVNGKSEFETFHDTYKDNASINTVAKGYENAPNVSVTIDAKADPVVSNPTLESMLDTTKYPNVTIIADYSKVDDAISKADAVDKSLYTEESLQALTDAINAVVRDLDVNSQTDVDAMADVINNAINNLVYKSADYTKVNAAISETKKIDKTLYTEESLKVLTNAINAVVRDKNITEQSEVDKMAQAISDALTSLVLIPEVPQTFDGIIPIITMVTISLGALLSSVIYLKKNNKTLKSLFIESV